MNSISEKEYGVVSNTANCLFSLHSVYIDTDHFLGIPSNIVKAISHKLKCLNGGYGYFEGIEKQIEEMNIKYEKDREDKQSFLGERFFDNRNTFHCYDYRFGSQHPEQQKLCDSSLKKEYPEVNKDRRKMNDLIAQTGIIGSFRTRTTQMLLNFVSADIQEAMAWKFRTENPELKLSENPEMTLGWYIQQYGFYNEVEMDPRLSKCSHLSLSGCLKIFKKVVSDLKAAKKGFEEKLPEPVGEFFNNQANRKLRHSFHLLSQALNKKLKIGEKISKSFDKESLKSTLEDLSEMRKILDSIPPEKPHLEDYFSSGGWDIGETKSWKRNLMKEIDNYQNLARKQLKKLSSKGDL